MQANLRNMWADRNRKALKAEQMNKNTEHDEKKNDDSLMTQSKTMNIDDAEQRWARNQETRKDERPRETDRPIKGQKGRRDCRKACR